MTALYHLKPRKRLTEKLFVVSHIATPLVCALLANNLAMLIGPELRLLQTFLTLSFVLNLVVTIACTSSTRKSTSLDKATQTSIGVTLIGILYYFAAELFYGNIGMGFAGIVGIIVVPTSAIVSIWWKQKSVSQQQHILAIVFFFASILALVGFISAIIMGNDLVGIVKWFFDYVVFY